jgi:hypothetical protein
MIVKIPYVDAMDMEYVFCIRRFYVAMSWDKT